MKAKDQILELKHFRKHGFQKGVEIGFPEFREHINFIKGNTLWIHGFAGHKKSLLAKWIHIQLAKEHGWKTKVYDKESKGSARVIAEYIQAHSNKLINHLTDDEYRESFKFVNTHFDVCSERMHFADFLKDLDGFDAVLIDHIGNMADKVTWDWLEENLQLFEEVCDKHKVHGTILTHPKKDQKYKIKQLTDKGEEIVFFSPPTQEQMWMGSSWDKYGYNILCIWSPPEYAKKSNGDYFEKEVSYLYMQKVKPFEAGKKTEEKAIKAYFWSDGFMFHDEEFSRFNHKLKQGLENESPLDAPF